MMLMGRFSGVDHCDLKYRIFGAPRKIRRRQTVYAARRKSPPQRTNPVEELSPQTNPVTEKGFNPIGDSNP